MTPPPRLSGSCTLLPGPWVDPAEAAAELYADLAASHGSRNVLVLKRHPTGLERLTEAIGTAGAGEPPRSPRVESVPEHASKTIEAFDPTLERLEYEERIELISLVIDGADREIPDYLERAADREGFARDVGQLLLGATRQRLRLADLEDPHDCLAFLYATNDRFHEVLEERGYVERADVIPRAVSLLEDDADGVRGRVTSSFDAVLAVEFEEFRRLDRRYLAALTDDAELVCLGRRHASVERTRVEPGAVDAIAREAGLEIEPLEPERAAGSTAPHGPIARFLATGEAPSRGTAGGSIAEGRARRIRARSAREQTRAVAREIQALRERRGWTDDEIAVAVPGIERVPETRRRLREAGIPTATIGTPSLAEDPVVNELYAFVTLQARRERGAPPIEDDDTTSRLRARVPGFDRALLEDCDGSSVRRSLERWIQRTDLKGRIAREESWLDAREQFEGLERVLEIAGFVEETDLVGPDWGGLRRMLRRTIRYDAPYVHAVETSSPTGGVAVCAAEDLKYDSREAVFLLDLVDDRYPGDQHLTRLFPRAWLEAMPNYPAVTDPTPETVAETFAPVDDPDDVTDPFGAYHAQRSRRRLALAAGAARTRLYCCSYERGSGGLRRTHEESRYLRLAAASGLSLDDLEAGGARIRGEAAAIEALLAQPRGELERVLREASTGGRADLGETEELFEEIALLLAEDDLDPVLEEAIRSQFEFAAGEVVRNE
ncbi:PD-(D/E)XK nuclease family protein [Natronococcus jeotgali]|uniref:UvrD/REP helicase n=1 Tax=Natronococcus jeotgali DSM 18795 TaxID=1227498 RepID=L9XWE8_9EURY|nr:hypothetical protein [Natronococcus jeotgali]ELY65842.1 hypothetical protein C492_02592 [Natronococcus jeotgali DSM 18795]